MTELQKREFALLRLFVDICEQLNLNYYMVCGSALGAVKYGGFIPWDDDIDVALPRKDYEIFLEKAQERLPDWCFVQNFRTDPEFHLLGTKLRDSRTTFVEACCQQLDIHHGVFIDVFPLDAYPEGEKHQKELIKRQKKFEAQRRVRLQYRRFTSWELFHVRNNFYYILYQCFGMFRETSKYIQRYEKFISSWAYENSKMICNHANSISKKECALREQYGNGTWAVFEGLRVRIPEQYDTYLTQKYGQWREELPKEQQVGHHHAEIIDLGCSYLCYRNVMKNKMCYRRKYE